MCLPSVLSMLVGLEPVASIDLQSLGASAPARWRSLVPPFDRSASFRAFKRNSPRRHFFVKFLARSAASYGHVCDVWRG